MNNYKVCILAAGVGNRMGELSNHVNKAVLPVNFKAVISYIVEKFPKEVEIIIAVGHKKETITDYLSLAYPDRRFTYVHIKNYVGPGTGPGDGMLQCKDYLQCPFVFSTADTIVLEEIPPLDQNWFGIAPVKETEQYCTVKIKNNLICQLDDKVKVDNKYAFIGLAGVRDYEDFFSALEKNRDVISGQIQVSNGFKKLIEKKLIPVGFTWFDTGTLDNYAETNKNFSGGNQKFDFSKGNEFLYFVDNKVIKFFADEAVAQKRCERAAKFLKGICPEIEAQKGGFYSYKKVDGKTLYSVLNVQVLKDFLQWAKLNLWRSIESSGEEKRKINDACRNFYCDKTSQRLRRFYEKTKLEDRPTTINGVSVPALKDLLDKINWDYLADGLPANFHGDLQFDNILVTRDAVSNLQKFILLDWRHDFGGLIDAGDIYYDLAKLYGGVTISYPLIKEKMFTFDMSGSSVYYNFFIKNDLLEAKEEYERFLQENRFDLKKIKLITALIFLNMSPLHQDPFDMLLYFMGVNMLHKALKS